MSSYYSLLNTRPIKPGKALNSLIKQAGGQTFSCPIIQIEMLESLNFDWSSFKDFDKVIFISQNAVEGFVLQLKKNLSLMRLKFKKPKIYAIGSATVISLNKAGFTVQDLSSQQFDSETLMDLPCFENLDNQKVLIVKGEGGRKFLENLLLEKGAKVYFCEVYKRRLSPFCSQSWLKFKQASLPIFLWTSAESFMGFKQKSLQFFNKNDFNWACQQPCVVFSERIKSALMVEGWQGKIIVVSTQSNQGIVEAIQVFFQEIS